MDTNVVNAAVTVVNPVVADANPAVVAETSKRRGRPAKFTGDLRDKIVSLLKGHTATETLAILSAKNGKEKSIGKIEFARAEIRRSAGFDDKVKITMPTLLKLAKQSGQVLRRGRPKGVKVEVTAAKADAAVTVDNPAAV